MEQAVVFIVAMFFYLLTSAQEIIDDGVKERAAEKNACNEVSSESEDWFDTTHAYLTVQFCEPAAWFDSFFSNPRIEEEFRPGSRVRWQNDLILTEGEGFSYETNLNFSFKLPKAKRSINIIFEGEQEESLQDIVPSNKAEAEADLGVLYEITKSPRANLSLRVKLSPSVTLRYRYSWPVSPTFITRFTQELFRRDSVYGGTSRIDFEKKLSDSFSFRQSNSGTVAENIDGTEWITGFVLLHRLSDISALSYESNASGVTDPDNFTKNARLGVRYRRNFYRPWLFYELAPAVTWPKEFVVDERVPIWEFLFRLEMNFINLG